jgi:hypothetical protein
MALTPRRITHARATGHVSHDAQVRIDKRVARILARAAADRYGRTEGVSVEGTRAPGTRPEPPGTRPER